MTIALRAQRYRSLPGRAHLPYLEAPDEIAALITADRLTAEPEHLLNKRLSRKDGMCRAVVPAQVGPPQLKRARCAQVVNRGA